MQIEKDVPPPQPRPEPIRFPFDSMEVGDSFLFSGSANLLRSRASTYGLTAGKKFATRTVDGGTRCWRTA